MATTSLMNIYGTLNEYTGLDTQTIQAYISHVNSKNMVGLPYYQQTDLTIF